MDDRQTEARRSNFRDADTGVLEPLYLSPKDLAYRWRCSRSTAQRIADREGFTKLFLGSGPNGMVRYIREEVEAYEASRSVTSNGVT